jgi:HK97 gp10 family phage protein
MSDDFSIDIHGLVETQRAIYEFSQKLGDRVTLLALRAGANFMLKKVRAAEPVKTGRLKRATVVKTSRLNQRRRNGKVGVYLTVKKGKKKDDPKGAYYGYFVEQGYQKGAAVIAGKQFVKNTFNANKNEALTLIVSAIEQGGERLIQQLRSR